MVSFLKNNILLESGHMFPHQYEMAERCARLVAYKLLYGQKIVFVNVEDFKLPIKTVRIEVEVVDEIGNTSGRYEESNEEGISYIKVYITKDMLNRGDKEEIAEFLESTLAHELSHAYVDFSKFNNGIEDDVPDEYSRVIQFWGEDDTDSEDVKKFSVAYYLTSIDEPAAHASEAYGESLRYFRLNKGENVRNFLKQDKKYKALCNCYEWLLTLPNLSTQVKVGLIHDVNLYVFSRQYINGIGGFNRLVSKMTKNLRKLLHNIQILTIRGYEDALKKKETMNENKKRKKVVLTEEQLEKAVTILGGDGSVVAKKHYTINPDQVLIVSKYLNNNFARGNAETIGPDGMPLTIPIVAMLSPSKQVLKNMQMDELQDLLIDKYKKMFDDEDQRRKFLGQVMRDWYDNKIGLYGSLSVNHL